MAAAGARRLAGAECPSPKPSKPLLSCWFSVLYVSTILVVCFRQQYIQRKSDDVNEIVSECQHAVYAKLVNHEYAATAPKTRERNRHKSNLAIELLTVLLITVDIELNPGPQLSAKSTTTSTCTPSPEDSQRLSFGSGPISQTHPPSRLLCPLTVSADCVCGRCSSWRLQRQVEHCFLD